MEDPILVCCVSIEWFNSQNLTAKKILYKNAKIQLLRNVGIREIFLEVSQEKLSTTKLMLKDVNIFKKFMSEGKASIKFNSEKCSVFLSNAPPGSLILFLKTMFIKMTKDSAVNKGVTKEDMQKKMRVHLLSGKSNSFEEISPITNAELDRAKKIVISKSSVTTPSPPASKKRRLIDASASDNPKAAKKLYAPSPLTAKPLNSSQGKTTLNPDDPALLETLNEEQDRILEGFLLNSQLKTFSTSLFF